MTQEGLKAVTNLGAELGAVKRENEKLREIAEDAGRELQAWIASFPRASHHQAKALIARISAALSQQADPSETTEAYTARDMATAAAQGFRDGQGVMELVGYQFQGRNGEWNSFMDQRHYENTRADGTWQIRAIYTPASEQQGKFRMGDLVKKSSGSEWEGRVVGTYSTEQTKEGYAVESSAHRNSVQIYPVTALEAVE